MSENRYLVILFSITASLTLLVGLANFIINPLGVYAPPVFAGFNDLHPATTAYERLHKAEAVKRLKPDAIITGTSRADSGLDPRGEFFPGIRSYNYGLPASSIYEQRKVLEYCQQVHPLKKLVLTLDLISFNAKHLENKAFEPERLSEEALTPFNAFFNTYGTILSLDMLIATIKHLQALKHIERHGYILPNGRKDDTDIAYDIAVNGIRQRFDLPDSTHVAAVADNDVGSRGFNDFSFAYSVRPGDTTFQHLEAMLDFARIHNIDVVLIISPSHQDLPGLRAPPNLGALSWESRMEEWKKRLADIDRYNGRKYNAPPYPLWDFYYPNTLTLEPIPSESEPHRDMKWFWDDAHYRAELGDIVLRRVLGLPHAGPPDFGKRLV